MTSTDTATAQRTVVVNADLIAFCAKLGADADAVQGAGGNVSVKQGDVLQVKASGTWLRDAGRKHVFVAVSRREILKRHAARDVNLADLADAGLRPSIETAMHALIPQRYVVHVHCVQALAGSAHADAETLLRERLSAFRHVLVPPVMPGMPLALAVESALNGHPGVEVFLLRNHGLIVAGETLEGVACTLNAARNALALPVRTPPLPDLATLAARNDMGWHLPEGEYIQATGADPVSASLAGQAPLYPDHVVFLGPVVPVAADEETLSQAVARFEERFAYRPLWMLFPGRGVLAAPGITAGTLAMLDGLGRVAQRLAETFQPLRTLPEEIIRNLVGWDAEAYRRRLDT